VLELLALLSDLPPLMIYLALQLHPFEALLAVDFLLSAAVFHFLLALQGPLPGLSPGDDRSARRLIQVWKDPNGLRTHCQREDC